ncbi:FGFR1 oncogene partner isoform X2 [Lampris incognitus]|uniref:FGFR1 oncogene partner isoform X2 n=1 Tax=Lampris incognitus TaxID=2546036 RepID=UPI0024B5B800|nr:FGFR1 oncogene partner isoform X2 [Lampris incognitus]
MSATEDDTELRDLLIQNLENSGVLNKLKAEMFAAVFLAMDEQDKMENKTSLVNENLKKCLNTKDGRLVAGLVKDFLHVFNLDFTLAVFQPEINTLNVLDSREQMCRELGLSETEVNRNSPLLLEVAKRSRHKDRVIMAEGDVPPHIPKDLTPKQMADARKTFDSYDKDKSGTVGKEDVKSVFSDLLPHFNKSMLERFVIDELRAADKILSRKIDFQEFVELYKRLFAQCRSVVVQDSGDTNHTPGMLMKERVNPSPTSKIPRYKGHEHRGQENRTAKGPESSRSEPSTNTMGKEDVQLGSRLAEQPADGRQKRALDLDLEVEEDPDEGDSFFDDPLPHIQKTYSCIPPVEEKFPSGKTDSLKEKSDSSRARDTPSESLSEPEPPRRRAEPSFSRNGSSDSVEKGGRDLKAMKDKSGSLVLDEDIEYDEDFNSHRSDISRSELSIGEEIEEISIEGPDNSDKFDESTQDLSVSQLSQSHGADYIEEVA